MRFFIHHERERVVFLRNFHPLAVERFAILFISLGFGKGANLHPVIHRYLGFFAKIVSFEFAAFNLSCYLFLATLKPIVVCLISGL